MKAQHDARFAHSMWILISGNKDMKSEADAWYRLFIELEQEASEGHTYCQILYWSEKSERDNSDN